jgi:hypothetical protein
MSGGFYVSWSGLLTAIFVWLPAALGYYVALATAAAMIAKRRERG